MLSYEESWNEKEYKVEITETLSEIISVKANSVKEAREKAEEMYHKEKVVLDSSNYVNTKFKVLTTSKQIHKWPLLTLFGTV